MTTLRHLRNFWILGVATMVLACFSNAAAQARYKVQDLGVQHPDNLGMAMALNNYGWTENMEQLLNHYPLSTLYPPVKGTVSISIGELKLAIGTLGGTNSSINWNGINDPGEAVGMSETSVPDPNGEDICGFGTPLPISQWARLEERTVRSIGTASTTPGKPSVCPKHLFQIRMAKTFAASAHTLRVFRFFGKTA